MKRVLLALLLAVASIGSAVAADPGAPGQYTAPATETVAVYLIPLDDFPFEYAAALSRALGDNLRLNVKATLPAGTRELTPFPETAQYSAEEIIGSIAQITPRLSETGSRTVFVVLTTRDINAQARQLRFLFASHDKTSRISVISAARMTFGTPVSPARPEQIFLRVFKMVKRAVGELYFGLGRSTDINDVMYAPIMSLDDLDSMGIEFSTQ